MALTRKMLKAMGIGEEQIEEIIEAHTETVDGLKAYKTDAEKLPGLQRQLDEALKAPAQGGAETVLKTDYDKLKGDFDSYKADVEKKQTKQAKQSAYRALLKTSGVGDRWLDRILKTTDVDSLELGEDGQIKDADKVNSGIKIEWADLIETVETKGANTATPQSSAAKTAYTRDDIKKMSVKEINDNFEAIKGSLKNLET